MQPCAGVRLRDPEDPGDLRVGEAAGELQGDQVALVPVQRGERRAYDGAAARELGLLLGRRDARVLGVDLEPGPPLPVAELVERRVSGDSE